MGTKEHHPRPSVTVRPIRDTVPHSTRLVEFALPYMGGTSGILEITNTGPNRIEVRAYRCDEGVTIHSDRQAAIIQDQGLEIENLRGILRGMVEGYNPREVAPRWYTLAISALGMAH